MFLTLDLARSEVEYLWFGRLEVVDLDVEMELLTAVGVGELRGYIGWLMVEMSVSLYPNHNRA